MIKEKFEIGTKVLYYSTCLLNWIPAKIIQRRICYSVTKAILGYNYIVQRDDSEYGDNVKYRHEIKVGNEINQFEKKINK